MLDDSISPFPSERPTPDPEQQPNAPLANPDPEDRALDDEEIYFAFSATLRISGTNLPFDEISAALNLQPTHYYRAGERKGPRSPAHKTDAWSYNVPLPEEAPLEEHIDRLWDDIRHAKHYLLELKQRAKVNVFLGYRSNCGHAGIEVPHTCLEMFQELEIPFDLSIIVL